MPNPHSFEALSQWISLAPGWYLIFEFRFKSSDNVCKHALGCFKLEIRAKSDTASMSSGEDSFHF